MGLAGGNLKLTNCFLFNSSWGPKEGEEYKKIVYFWPPELEAETNVQVKVVGLVEAVHRFAETFSQKPAHSLHNQKTRIVWREVEEEFFLCFNLDLPYSKKLANKDSKDASPESVLEFRPEDVNDSVLLAVLDRAYQMFSLFNGGFKHVLGKEDDREKLRGNVCSFFSSYLESIRIDQVNILDLWGGVQYLPLQPVPFLRVQTLVNRIQESFPCVHSSVFLQQGQLVWSGLAPSPSRLLAHHLATTLLPTIPALQPIEPTAQHQARFLLGGEVSDNLIKVHLSESEEPLSLVVIHAINSTLCLVMSGSPSASLLAEIGPTLSDLSADLTHLWEKSMAEYSPGPGSDQARFLYFNQSNFAVKFTVEPGNEAMVQLAADLAKDLEELSGACNTSGGEITAKLHNDQWLVVRLAGLRTVVVLLQQKNLNLMEVAEEVARLDRASFSKIYTMF